MGSSESKRKAEEKSKLEQEENNERLVGTAVLFLEGKGIEDIPDKQKRIFLAKKGLTDEMINEAYQRHNARKEAARTKPDTTAPDNAQRPK